MKSPCINLCKILGGVCCGCGRTLEEIKTWTLLTDEEREVIMKRLEKEKDNGPT